MPRPAPSNDPRSGPTDDTTQAVLMASFRLMMSEGISSLTPSRLHKETGVARTTIYRHWPDKLDIVADLLAKATERNDLADYTGDLEADLRTAVATLTWRFEHRPLRQMLGACVAADQAGDYGQDIAADYISGLIAPIVDVIGAAQNRGELSAGEPSKLAAELAGPMFLRHAFLKEDLPAADVEAMIVQFLANHRAG